MLHIFSQYSNLIYQCKKIILNQNELAIVELFFSIFAMPQDIPQSWNETTVLHFST